MAGALPSRLWQGSWQWVSGASRTSLRKKARHSRNCSIGREKSWYFHSSMIRRCLFMTWHSCWVFQSRAPSTMHSGAGPDRHRRLTDGKRLESRSMTMTFPAAVDSQTRNLSQFIKISSSCYPRFCVWMYLQLFHTSLVALSTALIVIMELFCIDPLKPSTKTILKDR
jgi:hypothetical protein